MVNRSLMALVVLCVAFLIVSAGTVIYFTQVMDKINDDKDFDLGTLRLQVSDLNSQVEALQNSDANLTSQINHLNGLILDLNGRVANVNDQVAELQIANIVTALGSNYVTTGTPRLYIAGSVVNTGRGLAYNAGLHITAYTTNHVLSINMTVPFSFVNTYSSGSIVLTTLLPGLNTTVSINIKANAPIANWTITPVWTNTP